jgi:hypothetical protein
MVIASKATPVNREIKRMDGFRSRKTVALCPGQGLYTSLAANGSGRDGCVRFFEARGTSVLRQADARSRARHFHATRPSGALVLVAGQLARQFDRRAEAQIAEQRKAATPDIPKTIHRLHK